MITKLHIENFKSLGDFDLPPSGYELSGFTCLIGLNGSGKTTLLQAFDFMAHLVTGDVKKWLAARDWAPSELTTHLAGKRSPLITFRLALSGKGGEKIAWQGKFNTTRLQCTSEEISKDGKVLLELNDAKLFVSDGSTDVRKAEPLNFIYEGSVLSTVALNKAATEIAYVKDAIKGLKSLELLSPHQMRRRARDAEDIGSGGEKLSAYLATFTLEQRKKLLEMLKSFYPHLTDISVKSLRSGWKNLRIKEDYEDYHYVEAAHMNDGLLRVIAILSQAQSSHSFLLFDEIENGINPELVQKLMDFLMHLGRQVIVTTHSPMILNYIPDDLAKEAVILIYKLQDGRTRCIRFFDLPQTQEKLRALGPGEVFVDTQLSDLIKNLPGA